jgi:hypothetical protein
VAWDRLRAGAFKGSPQELGELTKVGQARRGRTGDAGEVAVGDGARDQAARGVGSWVAGDRSDGRLLEARGHERLGPGAAHEGGGVDTIAGPAIPSRTGGDPGRAVSTVSREVAANGGRSSYLAWKAHLAAAERARRPKRPKLACGRLAAQVASGWRSSVPRKRSPAACAWSSRTIR